MRVELAKMTEAPVWADANPINAEFGGNWTKTIAKLEYELDRLKVDVVVVEITGPKIEIRRDGWMSKNSKLSPPVIVSFEHPTAGHLQYRSGHYREWHSNVHAVALTLERLRAIDRYGCAPSGQQYTGWAALPAATDPKAAIRVICKTAGVSLADVVDEPVTKAHYREALKRAHPDHGGSSAQLATVQEAGRALGLT